MLHSVGDSDRLFFFFQFSAGETHIYTILPQCFTYSMAGKPEAVVLDGLACIIDGRYCEVTVDVRPSDPSMLTFLQVRLLRLHEIDN